MVKIDSRYATLEPISMGLKDIHAATGAGYARGLALRIDHGTQYLSDHFHNQLRHWGIKPSFGFIHGPEANGVAKRFSRTLKEQAIYGRIFQNSDAPRAAVARFVETYNQHWLVAKLGHPSPTQARHEYALAFAA
jgi:transposase InsO family protein